jgi:hypothetical protein
MHPNTFDRFASTVGKRLTRRQAFAASAAGLTAFGLPIGLRDVAAQDASPVAESGGPAFLFVQLAEGGSWAPSPDAEGEFILTLFGASGQTLFFSDRPERIVGTVATDQFLDALGFTPVNPPNAALVVTTADGERDVLVIELYDPVYSEAFGENAGNQVTYRARVLEAYTGEGLATWSTEQEDDLLPAQFDNASLFIDDCPDATPLTCYDSNCDSVGDLGNQGMCWSWSAFSCQPCNGGFDGTSAQCNNKFWGACVGQCTTVPACQIL